MRRDHTLNLKFLYGSNRVGVVPPITSLPFAGWTRSLIPGVFFVAFLSLPIGLLLMSAPPTQLLYGQVRRQSRGRIEPVHLCTVLRDATASVLQCRALCSGWCTEACPKSPAAFSLTRQRRARSARHTRSGVSGNSRSLSPVSRASALATAGLTGIRLPSPAPLAPKGPLPSAFSTKRHSSAGGASSARGTRYASSVPFRR